MNSIEQIAIKAKKVIVEDGVQESNHRELVLSLCSEMNQFGLIVDQAGFDRLMKCNSKSIIINHEALINVYHSFFNLRTTPLYKNFPNDVMSLSDSELYFNAMMHYLSNGKIEPVSTFIKRASGKSCFVFNPVSVVDQNWIHEYAHDLLTFNKPLAKFSLDDLVYIIKNVQGISIPQITVKETLCSLAAEGINVPITNATDVLRIAVYLSGGNVSLPNVKDKFKKFNRSQRKFILEMIEKLPNVDASDFQPNLNRWIRLGEILHPGEYEKKFPKTCKMFKALRNQKSSKVRTFNGKVVVEFNKSFDDGMKFLSNRPGELGRRLDSLMRKYGDKVIPYFKQCADRISGKVLSEMYDHFSRRNVSIERSVLLRSGLRKVIPALEKLDQELINRVQATIIEMMYEKISKKPKIMHNGEVAKIFVEDSLKKIPVPFSMNSSSEGVGTLVRGTRTKISDSANMIRAFTHWYDAHGNYDLDLSAAFYSESFDQRDEITFYELTNDNLRAYHSGDIRHRVGNNAEYIDFDIDSCLKNNVRYVVFKVFNFNGGPIFEVPETGFGLIELPDNTKNVIFDTRTVTNTIKMVQPFPSSVPVVFDLQEREWIWLDFSDNCSGIPVLNAKSDLKRQIEYVCNETKMSIYWLLTMNAEVRAKLVFDKNEADIVFTADDFRTNYTKLASYMID